MINIMLVKEAFFHGVRSFIPIIPGVIPFGLIMGAAASNSGLNLFEMEGMNFIMFAGSSQLVAVDLMNKSTEVFVIILTGLIINLRMALYSAALAPFFVGKSFLEKMIGAYFLTDQAYAVFIADEGVYKDPASKISLYLGSGIPMCITWHIFVIIGMYFGNVTPKELSLDFAVPLSFMALMMPTIRNKIYIYVAVFSGILSLVLYKLPFNLGLLSSTILAVGLGVYLTRNKGTKQ